MATEALVSFAKARTNRVFLQDTNEITFNDENMEVGYSNHNRPFYLAASINQILIKRALVDTGTSINLVPFSTLQAIGIPKNKIQGYPHEGDGIQRKRRVHGRIDTTLAEGRPNSHLGSIPCSKDRSFLPCTIGKVVVAQASPHPVHLLPMREKDIEWQNDTDCTKPIPIRAGRGSLGRNYVLR